MTAPATFSVPLKKQGQPLPPVDFRGLAGPVAGVDEVGRGCLAGPVVAAAVVLGPDFTLEGLTDSKLLTPQKRALFAEEIKRRASAWSVSFVGIQEIDELNILWASMLAMRRSIERLSVTPRLAVVDGNCRIPELRVEQMTLVQGDLRCLPVSAASVLAKVARDEFMTSLEKDFPGYGFAEHKGYGTPRHREAIARQGITPWHRRSFAGVAEHVSVAVHGLEGKQG